MAGFGCPPRQILFYFKDEPVQPSAVDPNQLAAVTRFKATLGPLGGLYWMFSTSSEFQSFVRVHLARVVQRWTGRAGEGSLPEAPPSSEEQVREGSTSTVVEEEGFIDLMESANEALEKVNQVVQRMTKAISDLGQSIQARAAELQSAKEKPSPPDVKAIKRTIQGAAEDLDEYVARTQVDTPVFGEQLKRGVTAYGKAAIIARDFGEDGIKQVTQALETLRTFRSNLTTAKGHLITFRAAVAGTPRMTTAYNHSKRRGLETLDSLLREYNTAVQLIQEVEKSLEDFLQ